MIARHRGFGLIEIMVGLAVGAVSMLVIFQLYSAFEDQKRATTTGGDAQTNGALAQYILEREIRSAGNGITEGQPQQYPAVTGCLTTIYDKDKPYLVPNSPANAQSDSMTAPSGSESVVRFAPAIITAGAAGPTAGRRLSDSITIISGTSVISAPYTFAAPYAPGGSTITLTSNAGINVTDAHTANKDMLVVIERDSAATNAAALGLNYMVPKRCVLLQATAVPNATTVTVSGGRYNKAGGTSGQPTYSGEARLYNLGLLKMVTYRIAPPPSAPPTDTSRNLVADITKFGVIPNGTTNPAEVNNLVTPMPVASNIVNMQAQYGVDLGNAGTYLSKCPPNPKAPIGTTDADGVVDPVDGWVEPTDARWKNDPTATPSNPSLFDLRRIRAIRIGLVARSAVKEVPKPGDPVNYPNYPNCSTTTIQPTIHWNSGPDMKPELASSSSDKDWQCYRYKVFQITIPIRNAIWSSTMNPASPASCGLR